MKKTIPIVLSVFFLAFSVLAQGIQVTFPRQGNRVYKKSSFRITWNNTGCESPRDYKINIFRNSVNQANFVEQLTVRDAESVRWSIAESYSPGNYVIRVKTSDNLCKGDSGIFYIDEAPTIDITIDEAGSEGLGAQGPPNPGSQPPVKRLPSLNGKNLNIKPPGIQITFPGKDHKWDLSLGDTALPFPIRIQWKKTGIGIQDSHVKIFLNRVTHGRRIVLITERTANNGLYRGEISRDHKTALYTITIQTLDGKIKSEGPTFYITGK